MKRTTFCAVLLLMLSACSENKSPEEDVSIEAPAPVGGFMSSIDAGKAAASATCFECHGSDGKGTAPEVPNLAGQHKDYILTASKEYKTGTRKNGLMKKNLETLTDTELANVAEYYASLAPVGGTVGEDGGKEELGGSEEAGREPEIDPVLAGAALTPGCEGCHGAGGNSTLPGTPTLAGQPAAYTIAAMRAYQEGERNDEIMTSLAQALSEKDTENIAAYYAVQIPLPRKVEITVPGAAEGCDGCHGEGGNSSDPITPSLAGQDAQYLVAATKAYKDGPRTHALMKEIVASLSNQEINALATYYATREPKAQVVLERRSTAEWVKICERCHGPGGISDNPRFPNLAGQQETYLVNALQAYKQKTRVISMMHAMVWPLDDTDIQGIAAYYAGK
ncbi:MAG: c-type cytochrome [Gammaproteobacteria bacterium]